MPTVFSLPVFLIILFFLALLSFFISASETSIIALSKIRLRHLMEQKVRHAQNIHRLITKFDTFITAILVGNNFVNIAMSALITAVFVNIFGYKLGVITATLVTALFILILCEITPKILAIKHTERIALLVAPLWEVVIKLFAPVISVFSSASNFILSLLNIPPQKRSALITEEELRLMIEIGKEEGVLSDEERKMLHRIFEFGDTKVKDVMIPKEEIVAVNIKVNSDELLDIFVEKGHARLPVYDGSIDNIAGIVYAHDLLYILRDKGLFVLHDLLHKPYFTSENMRVNELLRVFQADKIQIAIAINDKKKTVGLVTLENLIEEIVGEIAEEKNKFLPAA